MDFSKPPFLQKTLLRSSNTEVLCCHSKNLPFSREQLASLHPSSVFSSLGFPPKVSTYICSLARQPVALDTMRPIRKADPQFPSSLSRTQTSLPACLRLARSLREGQEVVHLFSSIWAILFGWGNGLGGEWEMLGYPTLAYRVSEWDGGSDWCRWEQWSFCPWNHRGRYCSLLQLDYYYKEASSKGAIRGLFQK